MMWELEREVAVSAIVRNESGGIGELTELITNRRDARLSRDVHVTAD